MTKTPVNSRVTVIDGWAVRNLNDGSQVRARLTHGPYHPDPERDIYTVESQTRTLTDAMYADPSDPDDGWEDCERVSGHYRDGDARYALSEALSVYESEVPWPYDVTTETR